MLELKIDPEFENLSPPCDEKHDMLLEKSILECGVLSPIITWNGTIVDGHRRYKILQKHRNISFGIYEMHFNNRDEAINWIFSNQLMRRNLNEMEMIYIDSKLKD